MHDKSVDMKETEADSLKVSGGLNIPWVKLPNPKSLGFDGCNNSRGIFSRFVGSPSSFLRVERFLAKSSFLSILPYLSPLDDWLP